MKTQSVVIYQPILHASANQDFKGTAKNFVQTSMNVRDRDRVVSTLIALISLETTRASVMKASKEIHTTDVLTSTNVLIQKLVDRVLFARILKAIIAAIAQKDSMETPDQLAVLTTMNVQDRLAEETHIARMKLELSGATVLKDL